MGIASFLGNMDLNQIADLLEGAAEINRPGGSLANLQRNRIAQKLMQSQMEDADIERLDKKKRRAALDELAGLKAPTAPNSLDFNRIAPTALDAPDMAPEINNAPKFSSEDVQRSLMRNPLPAPELDAARKQFVKQDIPAYQDKQRELLMTGYPDLAGQLALRNMTPEYKTVGKTLLRMDGDNATPVFEDTTSDELTAWQKTQVENQDRQFGAAQDTAGMRHSQAMARIGAVESAADRRALPRAPKDYYPNPKNQTALEDADFIVIPNSPTDLNQKRQLATDKAMHDQAIQQINQTMGDIDILAAHPSLGSVTGIVGSRMADDSALWLPDQKDAIVKIMSLKARNFLDSLTKLKANGPSGLGSLTETEGKKITDAVGVLDRAVGKDNFIKALNDLKSKLNSSKLTFDNKFQELYPDQGVIDEDAFLGGN